MPGVFALEKTTLRAVYGRLVWFREAILKAVVVWTKYDGNLG